MAWARPVALAAVAAILLASPARADAPPYELPASLPTPVASPAVDPQAPYTPLVRSLIKQLEPSSPPTLPELQNAAKLFQGFVAASTATRAATGSAASSPRRGRSRASRRCAGRMPWGSTC